MHVLSYGENIWLKHAEIEINFKSGFKGLKRISHRMMSSPQCGVYTEYTYGKFFDLWANWEINVI